jgi:hypothetical protein
MIYRSDMYFAFFYTLIPDTWTAVCILVMQKLDVIAYQK